LVMEGEVLIGDEMDTKDINSNQKETAELASDANATEDQNMGCSQDNQAEDSNGEEDDDDEEEEEEEDAEGAYTFRFEEDVNPLALTEVDANGVQPYEHLERIEYEALAAKKRKSSLDYYLQDVPAEKRLRQEDNPQALFDNLLAEMTKGRRKSKKMRRRGRRVGSRNKLSPEITRKLGDATLYYVHGRYEEAITLLKELILLSPNLPDSYHTLGMIYNAMGDKKRALAFYMLAVHLTPKDASIWKLLVTWSLLVMEGEVLIGDEMDTKDINSNQKETAELASDANATEDQNMGNGEEDDDDEEEEEEEDAEGAYTFRFEEDVNPLALTEVDANGVQPYEHLERIEYEALAAKKRKSSLDYYLQDVPAEKRLRQEDNPQALFDNLLAEMTKGRRKSKKMRRRGRRVGSRNKLSPEITRKLGDATLYYVHGRYEEAITLLKELILLSPNLPDSYHTLGMIYNAMGDKKRALAFYMLAVHLTPKDASIWKLLVTWS
nr:general transcription factor 3C polypeptide 3-like isoform X1 [Tanacetum cinerariifolium]